VVANALSAVQALQGREGMLAFLDRPTAVMLLKRLRDFNEWSQCLVLELLAESFRPESDDEMFEASPAAHPHPHPHPHPRHAPAF
jgi:AP-4 complex subunit beta-1